MSKSERKLTVLAFDRNTINIHILKELEDLDREKLTKRGQVGGK